MGAALYEAHSEVRQLFDDADRALGFSLTRLCFEGPESVLNGDLHAQIAAYTVSCAVTDLLKSQGVFPDRVSGYSSGFYAAAYAADCLDFVTGLRIVKRAGEILLDTGRGLDGGMGVIFGLSAEEVNEICARVGGCQVAIRNTPRQTVVSGLRASLARVMEISLVKGALDAYPLSAETAYHSAFMEGAGERLLQEIRAVPLRDPRVPLYSYLTLMTVPTGDELKLVMARQLSGTVHWVDLVRALGRGCSPWYVEVGSGELITRTIRWIDRRARTSSTFNREKVRAAVETYRAFLSNSGGLRHEDRFA